MTHDARRLTRVPGAAAAAARQRPWRLVERNVLAYRRIWYVFLTGFVEPVLFLLSIGIGVGELVGRAAGRRPHWSTTRSSSRPGCSRSAAMNGALLDTTFNFFVKYKYSHTYDAILATPLGTGDVAVGRGHVGAAARRDLLDARSS